MSACRQARFRWIAPFLLVFACSAWADSGALTVQLTAERDDLSDALVSLHTDGATVSEEEAGLARMNQVNRAFSPRAIAVRRGARVRFQNDDDVRHHVYSFSRPKRFELPLYEGQPPEDIRFNEPGLVVLGCNIHDWMVGWVHVMDTPWFDFADAGGRVTLSVPPGQYELRIWHPELETDGPRLIRQVRVPAEGATQSIGLPLSEPADDDGLNRRRDRFR